MRLSGPNRRLEFHLRTKHFPPYTHLGKKADKHHVRAKYQPKSKTEIKKTHSHTKIHCRVLHLTKGKLAPLLIEILIKDSYDTSMASSRRRLCIAHHHRHFLHPSAGLLAYCTFYNPVYTFLTRVFKKVAVVPPPSTREPSVTQLRLLR